ncbi:MAG: hemerythrin domain-containing protein [Planctomycetes bacterium]|nr:hemerythrin domain-containing protein [Planctomycetota bacterium]
MIQTYDAREVAPQQRAASLIDRLKQLRPGTELDVVMPQNGATLLQAVLLAAPHRFWFSPVDATAGSGLVRFIARLDASAPRVAEYLSWDHDRLDAILVECMRAADAGDWQNAQRCATSFRHGLFRHIAVENDILFAECEERTGMRDVGPTAVMRHEHEDIQHAVDEIVKAAAAKDSEALQRWHANLLGVLVEHNMKEEQILYPGTDRMLDDATREQLVQRLLLG